MPGSARRGAAPSITASAVNTAGAPCPTCPGGRAGPGGAYAFRESGPAAGQAAGARGGAGRGRGGAGGGPRLVVSREPASFTALASAPGDLQTRATNVLARIDWPGKPGAASPVTPLTAAEQQSFDAGREVYRNVCQALSSARWARARTRRADAHRVGAGARAGGDHLADPAQRQGRARRSDATDWVDPE